ncbi:MAG: M50 family metallopeptidase [Anaerolineae bacterium]|nr:M50 family metallopeptidase [Anaerolineae bacterium]
MIPVRLPPSPPPAAGHRGRNALLLAGGAAILSLVLLNVPVANTLLYPVRLLVTLVHEGGHALATLLTGGGVQQITLEPDGSGLTVSAGGWRPVILSAGYVGAAATGALMLYLLRTPLGGRAALYALAVVLGALTLFFVRNLFGFVTGAGLTVALALAARFLPELADLVLAAFLAVQLCLMALLDLFNLLFSTGLFPVGHNDAVFMSRIIPLPPLLWALLWSAASVGLVWLAVRGLWRGMYE